MEVEAPKGVLALALIVLEGLVLETTFCIHHRWSALENLEYIKATYAI